MNNSNTIEGVQTASGGGITSATTSTNYAASSFGSNTYTVIPTTKTVAFVKYNGDQLNNYTANYNGGNLTLDIGFVPTLPVTIGYYN